MRSQKDVLKQMEGFVEGKLGLLKSVSDSWQPSDLLPDMVQGDWNERVRQLRERARGVPDEVLVVLIGNTVTEEALPTYQTMLTRHPGIGDETGHSKSPWARWSRGWTAEENRHGEILTRYLYLSGRVDMRAVEITTQHLIRNGFDPRTDNDPYRMLAYTSFQERATKISHGNTARLANQRGDSTLGKICAVVTGDEARHEEAYKLFFGKILEEDPSGGVLAFARMMKNTIAMPARFMEDGETLDLYGQFSAVAQRIGVYTVRDYADILEHLAGYWKIADLSGLTGKAAEAQAYLGGLAQRYRGLADRTEARAARQRGSPFRWIFNRPAS